MNAEARTPVERRSADDAGAAGVRPRGASAPRGGGGWRRIVCLALVFGAMGAVAAPGVRLWQETTAHDWRLLGLGTLARARPAAGADENSVQRYEWTAGEAVSMPLAAIAADPKIDWTRERVLGIFGEMRWRGAAAGCAAGLAALVLLAGWRLGGGSPCGRGARDTKRLPGRRSGAVLGRIAAPVLAAMPRRAVRIAGIPYPADASRGHTLVAGAAGSGRQALIAGLIAGVRARGGRCIVHDRTGEYTRRLFDPARDAILNPLDARAARWCAFRDARGPGGFEAMAAALIPEPADAGGEVRALAARRLFAESAEALRRRGPADEVALLDLLFDPAPGAPALDGTPAWTALARMGPEVLLPARALLRRHLAALRFAHRGTGRFSIRDWVGREDGVLFLASPDDPHGRLRGLASVWMETALGAAMSLDPDGERRVWVVIDDLPALHRLPGLLPALAEARRLGVRFVVGIEALGPLRARYGEDGARTVSGLCATRVAMAAADEETAAWSSAGIASESLAPAWRLQRFAPGRGVLRFPGRLDAVEFSLDATPACGAAARFVPVDRAWMFLAEAPVPPAGGRAESSETGGRAKREAARPPKSACSTSVRHEEGGRPPALTVRKRKRRRAGRWI